MIKKIFNYFSKIKLDVWVATIFIIWGLFSLISFIINDYDNQFFLTFTFNLILAYLIYRLFFFRLKLFSHLFKVKQNFIKIPFWIIVLSVIIFSIIVITVYYCFLWHDSGFVSLGLFFSAFLSILFNIFLFTLFLLGINFLLLGVGKKILSFFKFNTDYILESVALHFSFGLLVLVLISFFLALFGLLNFWVSLSVVLIIALLSYREIIYYLGKFFKARISINIIRKPLDFYTVLQWSFLVFGFVLSSFFIVLSLRTTPLKADDLSSYYRVAELIFNYHHLVPLPNSATASLVGLSGPWQAFIMTLLSPRFVFVMQPLYIFFLVLLTYILAEKFFSKKIALLSAWLVAIIRWHIYFVASQKTILLLVLFSLASVYCLLVWLQGRKNSYLYLSAIFLGFSFGFKLNSLLLILPIFSLLAFLFLFKKIEFKKLFLFIFLTAVFSSPWLLVNINFYGHPLGVKRVFSPKEFNPVFVNNQQVTLHEFLTKSNLGKIRSQEVTLITRQNMISDNQIKNFFWGFWRTSIKAQGFDRINPVLLVTMPLFLLLFFVKHWYRRETLFYILTITFLGFILWLFVGSQRTWYAAPFFYLLSILSAVALLEFNFRLWRYFVLVFLFSLSILFICNSLTRILPFDVGWLAGDLKINDVMEKNPWYVVAQDINKEISSGGVNKILFILDQRASYIKENDKYIITDGYGAFWSQIVREGRDFDGITKILHQQGISHIFFSKSTKKWLSYWIGSGEYDNLSLFRDIKFFEKYKQTALEEIFCSTSGLEACFYKVK